VVLGKKYNICSAMNYERKDQLRNVQHRDKILAINEFDSPFPKYDLLPREGVVILKLQGFGVVSVIGFNLNLAKVGDLVLHVTHTNMYMRVQMWLKIGHGPRS
jgi:hypothetical protein